MYDEADSNEPNAAIYSKSDLAIGGTGSLTVNANYNHGIQSKDDLKITGGNLTVNAANDGLKGRDAVVVRDGVITITAGGVSFKAELNDGASAQRIWDAPPIEGEANTWGEEIYFQIPVKIAREPDARADVSVGELGYWAPGEAFCIFFGQTPVSKPGKIMPASAVNIIGKVLADPAQFKKVMNESQVTLEPG